MTQILDDLVQINPCLEPMAYPAVWSHEILVQTILLAASGHVLARC